VSAYGAFEKTNYVTDVSNNLVGTTNWYADAFCSVLSSADTHTAVSTTAAGCVHDPIQQVYSITENFNATVRGSKGELKTFDLFRPNATTYAFDSAASCAARNFSHALSVTTTAVGACLKLGEFNSTKLICTPGGGVSVYKYDDSKCQIGVKLTDASTPPTFCADSDKGFVTVVCGKGGSNDDIVSKIQSGKKTIQYLKNDCTDQPFRAKMRNFGLCQAADPTTNGAYQRSVPNDLDELEITFYDDNKCLEPSGTQYVQQLGINATCVRDNTDPQGGYRKTSLQLFPTGNTTLLDLSADESRTVYYLSQAACVKQDISKVLSQEAVTLNTCFATPNDINGFKSIRYTCAGGVNSLTTYMYSDPDCVDGEQVDTVLNVNCRDDGANGFVTISCHFVAPTAAPTGAPVIGGGTPRPTFAGETHWPTSQGATNAPTIGTPTPRPTFLPTVAPTEAPPTLPTPAAPTAPSPSTPNPNPNPKDADASSLAANGGSGSGGAIGGSIGGCVFLVFLYWLWNKYYRKPAFQNPTGAGFNGLPGGMTADSVAKTVTAGNGSNDSAAPNCEELYSAPPSYQDHLREMTSNPMASSGNRSAKVSTAPLSAISAPSAPSATSTSSAADTINPITSLHRSSEKKPTATFNTIRAPKTVTNSSATRGDEEDPYSAYGYEERDVSTPGIDSIPDYRSAKTANPPVRSPGPQLLDEL